MHLRRRHLIFTLLFLLSGWLADATTYFIDLDGGNNASDGLTQGTAWRNVPGTQNSADSANGPSTYGSFTTSSKIPRGTIFKFKQGSTYNSTDGLGSIRINGSSGGFYTSEGSSTYGDGYQFLVDTTWGSGEVLFDGNGMTIGIAMIVLQCDGVYFGPGFRFARSGLDGIQVKEKGTGDNTNYWTWIDAVTFSTNCTSTGSDAAGVSHGDINVRKASHFVATNTICDGGWNFYHGIRFGEVSMRAIDAIVAGCSLYNHNGDTSCGAGVQAQNSQLILTNNFSANNYKGCDLGEQTGGNVDILYLVTGNYFLSNNYAGIAANCKGAAGGYQGRWRIDVLNNIIVSNADWGMRIYADPWIANVVGNSFSRNGNAGFSGNFSGHFLCTPDACTFTNHCEAHVFNNLFFRPVDATYINLRYDRTVNDWTLDSDYNVFVQDGSEDFYRQGEFCGNTGQFQFGANGPGHASGNYYSQYSLDTTPPVLGTGHFHCDAHSTVILPGTNEWVDANFFLASPGPYAPVNARNGLDLSSKPWFTNAMAFDRLGVARTLWSIGPYEYQAPNPPPTPLSFTNSNGGTITDNTTASVYPVQITTSGITGVLTNMNLVLYSFTHGKAQQLKILLESPSGRTNMIVMADAPNLSESSSSFATSFTNTGGAVTINAVNAASPYPSTNTVSGLTDGTVTNITITLVGVYHTDPTDIDAVIASPSDHTNVMFLSDGGAKPPGFVNNTVTFDDQASISFPSVTPTNGTYKPTNIGGGDAMISPANFAAFGGTMSLLTNQTLNGDWHLYITDDSSGDSGSISNRWYLTFQGGTTAPDTSFSGITMTFDDLAASQLTSVPITTGSYKPTDVGPGDTITSPAPAPPYGANFSVFTNYATVPLNGTWKVYILDDTAGSSGSFGNIVLNFWTTPIPSLAKSLRRFQF